MSSQATMDGWLSTRKKKGDVAAAKEKAEAARRKRRGLKPKKPKAPKKDKFVVDSDEESESEISFVEESDEELSEVDDLLEDDDDDDMGSSFLPRHSKKTASVKVKPMLANAEKLKAKRKKAGFSGAAAAVSRSPSTSPSDVDDESDFERPSRARKPAIGRERKRPAVTGKRSAPIELESSDDDDVSPAGQSTQSKYFTKPSTNSGNNKRKASIFSEEDETPVKPKASNKVPGQRRAIDIDDDDDDDDFSPSPKKRQSMESWKPGSGLDSDIDDDEQVAIRAAMKASRKEQKKGKKSKGLSKVGATGRLKKKGKKNQQRKKNPFREGKQQVQDDFFLDTDDEEFDDIHESEEEEPEVVDIEDEESSSEEEREDDEQEEYLDPEAKEASNVLATANDLSAQVLKIMTTWASGNNDGEASGEKTSIPQGMIIDGALALRGSSRSGNQHKNSWISSEVLKEAVPDVKLADYQVLGVNWLSLLHSMTCKVGKDGKPTNVNGVLADEMGLGKTCQTIAFLAYLNYSRQNGAVEDGADAVEKKSIKDMSSDEEETDDDDVEVLEHSNGSSKKTSVKNSHAKISIRRKDEESSPSTRLPHLIVVPASVVSNWQREFGKFAPHMNVIKYHGTLEEREEMQGTLRPYLPKYRDTNLPMVDVILTTITYFQKESSVDRDFLKRFDYDYMIIDEAHSLKNSKANAYRNLNRFKTRHRLMLTGTPVQNSPQELMSLLCFLMPLFQQKRSGGYDEDEKQSDGGESMLQHFVSLEASSANHHEDSDAFAYRKLKQLFAPFVLRRRKVDVLSEVLPEKKYQTEYVDLEESAKKSYDSIIEAHLRAKKNKTNKATDHLFTQLRKAANHPLLLRSRHKSGEELDHLVEWFYKYGAYQGGTKEMVAQELKGLNDFDIHFIAHDLIEENPLKADQLERYLLTNDDLFCSAKFVRLREMLPKLIKDGHRILVFSVWTQLLNLLGCLLEHMQVEFRRMDGQTPVSERQEKIDEFNSDDSISVFLLSTKACGQGINLTAADTVIFHDIDLNPFSDLQAEDRCHRIGQEKPVTVIKLIANGTVDSHIHSLQQRKVKMNAAIMESKGEWSKEEKKHKAAVVQSVVDGFLKSPKAGGNAVFSIDDSDDEVESSRI